MLLIVLFVIYFNAGLLSFIPVAISLP